MQIHTRKASLAAFLGWALWASALAGCSGKTVADDAGQGGSGPPTEDECTAISTSIAAKAFGGGTCTTVVRLDYQTREILGFQMLCGPYNFITEADARATAMADTGHGASGTLLSGPDPADEFVFYEAPMDLGGVGAVSARSGLSVFGASLEWMGSGSISYPGSWQPAVQLGPGCVPPVNELPPTARGFDLDTTKALSDQDIEPVLDAVWNTALPDGLSRSGAVFDAMVLLYSPAGGTSSPKSALWIVLLNSGLVG